jgi:hypothetical protein
MDEEVVRGWPTSKIKGWLTFFQAKNDVEAEAYERAKRNANAGRN